MLTKKVYYTQEPPMVVVRHNGKNAVVEMPRDVEEVQTENGVEYLAENVYSVKTAYTPDLAERVAANYEKWLAAAAKTEPQKTTMEDIVEAISALTDILLEGLEEQNG